MDKVWLKNYDQGIPEEIDPNEYSSIADLLNKSFDKFADKDSYSCMGTTLTYRELKTASLKFASYLQNDLGLKKGSRVALMMPNILQYPIALFGVLQAGMVAVNVNPLYTARELEHQLKDSGAEAIVIFANSANVLEKVISNTPVKHVLVTQIGDLLKFPKNYIVNFVLKYVKKMVPDYSLPGSINFVDALANGDFQKFTPVEVGHEDTAFFNTQVEQPVYQKVLY